MTTLNVTVKDWAYTVEIHSYTKGKPAKLFAAPEDCYPAEDPEVEYDVVCITGIGLIEDLITSNKVLDDYVISALCHHLDDYF